MMTESISSSGPRVLVVDDAPVNLKLMRAILTAAGYRVLEASSGMMALEVMYGEKPDAMLLDVSMPGMTGYEVCEAVRRDPDFKALPVLMVTGLSLPEERVRGFEAGATEFITKPFDRRELLTRLRASLVVAEGAESALLDHLPGALVLTDLAFNIFGLSPGAASLLNLSRPAVGAFAFGELLDAKALAAARAGVEFQFGMNGRELSGLQQAVREPGGVEVIRVISLRMSDLHRARLP
jgi:two-component system, cell cycle response regulator